MLVRALKREGKHSFDSGFVHLLEQNFELVVSRNVLSALIFGGEILKARRAVSVDPSKLIFQFGSNGPFTQCKRSVKAIFSISA